MKRNGQDIRTFFKKRLVNQRETEEVETQKDSQSVEVESQKDSPEPPEDTPSPTGPHGMSQIR